MQWHCKMLQCVEKSISEFYFVQRFVQQKNCETTPVTLCNPPATCFATPLREKLTIKLQSVTAPYKFDFSQTGMTSRRVRQLHFTAWPDKGIPQHATAILAFRRKVRKETPANAGPTVIHCR